MTTGVVEYIFNCSVGIAWENERAANRRLVGAMGERNRLNRSKLRICICAS